MEEAAQKNSYQHLVNLADKTIAKVGILPFLFLLFGVLLLFIGLIILFKPSGSGVVIIDEATGSATKAVIQVDIEGAVIHPGVYTLPFGARIKDGLIAAGGFSDDADREYVAKVINLAARLTDGGKIYIPSKLQITNGQSDPLLGSNISLININSASAKELDTLPGIGPVTAEKIINNRPYQTIEELINKKIVNSATWEKIRDKITAY